jgi:hypothetical protein
MMSKNTIILVLIIVSILASGCATIPETATEVEPTLSTPLQKSTITPEIKIPTQTTTPVTPSPMPGIQLTLEDQVIFTIPNTEPWSGREGDPRPDWKGWGAETFIIVPDGSFWIADTAVDPNGLLHYNPQGELLQEISLEGKVVYPKDLALAQDSLWVLDVSDIQPKAIQLSLDGEVRSSVDVPPDIFSLVIGEKDELLLYGFSGYVELIDEAGEVTQRHLDTLSYYGHTYRIGSYDQATGNIPVYVDGAPFDLPPDFFVEADPFPGFNPDGSFALAGYIQGTDYPEERQVRYYDASGELLGTARQYPQTFYKDFNHHLAFGLDGTLYQLLSNPDHSVQIVRLGFSKELPPVAHMPTLTPPPLTAMLPPESAATDEEQARNALLAFFSNMSSGNYAEGAAYIGVEVSEYARAPLPGETLEAYWEYICNFLWCLPVAEVTDVEQISEDEYLFYVVFMWPDGRRFEIGACCGGDPAAYPPVWQFAYPVQKIDGEWKVMRGPLFTP